MTFRQWYYKQPAGELDKVRKQIIDLISPNMPATGKTRLYNFLSEKSAPKPLEQKAINEYAGQELDYPTGYKAKKKRAPKDQPPLL